MESYDLVQAASFLKSFIAFLFVCVVFVAYLEFRGRFAGVSSLPGVNSGPGA